MKLTEHFAILGIASGIVPVEEKECNNPDCEYQDSCCYFCDVCGFWYSKDEPCEVH